MFVLFGVAGLGRSHFVFAGCLILDYNLYLVYSGVIWCDLLLVRGGCQLMGFFFVICMLI